MVKTDLWTVLDKTQAYISRYYATALTDESKHEDLQNYIEKFVLDGGFLVEGFTDETLIERLYSEMVECCQRIRFYSHCPAHLFYTVSR